MLKFFHQRLEKLLIDSSTLITFKAVGKVNQFLEMINFNKDCYVLFYKGKKLSELNLIIRIIKTGNLFENLIFLSMVMKGQYYYLKAVHIQQ